MNCEQAQDALLQCEDPRRAPRTAPELAEHLSGCAACSGMARKLVNLEQAVWVLPVPASMENARTEFLRRLEQRPNTLASRRRVFERRRLGAWAAVAALVLMGLGLGVWLQIQHGQQAPTKDNLAGPGVPVADVNQTSSAGPKSDQPAEEESPDLVDRLIAWNLDLTQASSSTERDRVYADHAEMLKDALIQEEMSDPDRSLAEKLFQTGTLLARNDDPVVAADLFDDVADELLDRVDSAVERDDSPAVNRFVKRFSRVAEQGINAKLDRAVNVRNLTPDHQRRLDKIQGRGNQRVQALASMVQRAPEKSQKHVQHAMEAAVKQQKHKGLHGKKKAGKPE